MSPCWWLGGKENSVTESLISVMKREFQQVVACRELKSHFLQNQVVGACPFLHLTILGGTWDILVIGWA